MNNEHAVAAHWQGGYDEEALQAWVEGLRQQLRAPRVSLGLVFFSPKFFEHAEPLLELLSVHGQIPLLVGCSSNSLIAGNQEIEQEAGLVLGLYHFPGAELRAHHFTQEEIESVEIPADWHRLTGTAPEQSNGWLVFADPFHFDAETWLRQWNEAYPSLPILGGLASGDFDQQLTQIYLDRQVYTEGGVAISFGGQVALRSVISQGCTPIGETWTITKVDGNLIHQIGNRPAYEVLLETFSQLTPAEQKAAQRNLFVGLVINEYAEEFHRGDFLIRNLLGADPQSGALAVGALTRPGQTLQFQRRDAAAAREDLSALLARSREDLSGREIYGACLCSCNGRGQRLFGEPHHDAQRAQQELGPLGLTGFFCNGEIGPVGAQNFLHGYTASLALFVKK